MLDERNCLVCQPILLQIKCTGFINGITFHIKCSTFCLQQNRLTELTSLAPFDASSGILNNSTKFLSSIYGFHLKAINVSLVFGLLFAIRVRQKMELKRYRRTFNASFSKDCDIQQNYVSYVKENIILNTNKITFFLT